MGLGVLKKEWEDEGGKEEGKDVMVGVREGKKGGGGSCGEKEG